MRCHRRRRVTRYTPATLLRPKGSGGAGQLRRCCCLTIGPHRLRNNALHLTPRRHERYPTYFSDRLLVVRRLLILLIRNGNRLGHFRHSARECIQGRLQLIELSLLLVDQLIQFLQRVLLKRNLHLDVRQPVLAHRESSPLHSNLPYRSPISVSQFPCRPAPLPSVDLRGPLYHQRSHGQARILDETAFFG